MRTRYVEFDITPKEVTAAYAVLSNLKSVDIRDAEAVDHITKRLKKRIDMPHWMASEGGVMDLTEGNARVFAGILRKAGGPAGLADRIDPGAPKLETLADLVRPMDWVETKGGDLESSTEFGIYKIYRAKDAPFLMATCMGLRWRKDATATEHGTEDLAKAAAQADFARRTLGNMDVDRLLELVNSRPEIEPDEPMGPS